MAGRRGARKLFGAANLLLLLLLLLAAFQMKEKKKEICKTAFYWNWGDFAPA